MDTPKNGGRDGAAANAPLSWPCLILACTTPIALWYIQPFEYSVRNWPAWKFNLPLFEGWWVNLGRYSVANLAIGSVFIMANFLAGRRARRRGHYGAVFSKLACYVVVGFMIDAVVGLALHALLGLAPTAAMVASARMAPLP